MRRSLIIGLLTALIAGPLCSSGIAQADLADYFGFDGIEIVKIGRNAGPIITADMNGDGLRDLVAINNFYSRIEVHYQKKDATAADHVEQATRVNEFPEHWRFRREFISVTHNVSAVVAHDYDGDGLIDLIYAGIPSELVFVRQHEPGRFVVDRKHRIKNLNANRDGLAVANVIGDGRREVISLVNGVITIWTMNGASIEQPVELTTGDTVVAFIIADYNGDNLLDIAGIIPDDAAPARIWFGGMDTGDATLTAQRRFEMPALREFTAVEFPDDPAARIAVIERASKRLVLYEVDSENTESEGDRDAALQVFGFTDAQNRNRDVSIFDIDGDDLKDLIATDTKANSVVVYRQAQDKGLQAGESYPSLTNVTYLVATNVDDDPYAEVFVLSEEDGVVGRSDYGPDGLPFPLPLSISDGTTPVAMNVVMLEHGPHVAVVTKTVRDYSLELIDMDGGLETIELGSLSRAPETILDLDADQDGLTDLLLFTRDKPMTMLHSQEDGFKVLESKDMGQFGLVKAATAENIVVFDIDGDEKNELLIADKNFVRAVRYEPQPHEGVSPGWQVVMQINAKDGASKLVSLAILDGRVVAADQENNRLIIMGREDGEAGQWQELESVNVLGFELADIHAGAFSGDGQANILAVADEGFAVIRLAGERMALRQFAAWRDDDERRMQHELAVGDLNSDGYIDLVSLDAGEQLCQVFTFSDTKELLYALGFQVFESKLFSGGTAREYQPSMAIIDDVTGDGVNDLILLTHDRVLIYPQMVEAQ